MNSYNLSRLWFDWAFENPSKITPNHAALYFFCIEHCNRLGWKKEFGLPTTMAKEAIGIRNYKTYIKALNDLVEFGFIKMVEKSKNQYSSNIIALVNFTEADGKALGKASLKQVAKQVQSIDSIDKPITINNINNIEVRKKEFAKTLEPSLEKYGRQMLNDFYAYWTEPNKSNTKFRYEKETNWDLSRRLATWDKNNKKFGSEQTDPYAPRKGNFKI